MEHIHTYLRQIRYYLDIFSYILEQARLTQIKSSHNKTDSVIFRIYPIIKRTISIIIRTNIGIYGSNLVILRTNPIIFMTNPVKLKTKPIRFGIGCLWHRQSQTIKDYLWNTHTVWDIRWLSVRDTDYQGQMHTMQLKANNCIDRYRLTAFLLLNSKTSI